MNWMQTIACAIDYMEDHIAEQVTCEEIASHCYLSSFHFQRAFHLLTGLTIAEYLRNRRLSLAGEALASGRCRVIDAALDYGYDSPESFTKAFTRFHGVTPAAAKKEGAMLKSFPRLVIKLTMEGGTQMDYQIVSKEAFTVIAKFISVTRETEHDLPNYWTRYFNAGLDKSVPPMMGICTTAKDGGSCWRYGIGCSSEFAKSIPEGFEAMEIPAHTWGVFPCVGAMPTAIQNLWKRVYSEWLPQSGYELEPDADIEFYSEGDNSKADYYSEIWIPIKQRA